jgi:uncharacterized protein YbjT (DUF2867 family)
MGASAADADLLQLDSLRAALVGHDFVINLATHMPSSTAGQRHSPVRSVEQSLSELGLLDSAQSGVGRARL